MHKTESSLWFGGRLVADESTWLSFVKRPGTLTADMDRNVYMMLLMLSTTRTYTFTLTTQRLRDCYSVK